jgi:hypothetical protein
VQNRLAFLTNKCHGEADLEYYILEAAHILGLRLPSEPSAKVRPQCPALRPNHCQSDPLLAVAAGTLERRFYKFDNQRVQMCGQSSVRLIAFAGVVCSEKPHAMQPYISVYQPYINHISLGDS